MYKPCIYTSTLADCIRGINENKKSTESNDDDEVNDKVVDESVKQGPKNVSFFKKNYRPLKT